MLCVVGALGVKLQYFSQTVIFVYTARLFATKSAVNFFCLTLCLFN
jgi:hypothetical protein